MDTLHFQWDWTLKSSPEALWPLISNTDRFNFDLGLPPRTDATGDAELANARQIVRFSRFNLIDVEFQQEPFEWVQPYRYGFTRYFTQGPTREIRVLATLDPLEAGGTHLTYQTWVEPSSTLGRLAILIDAKLLAGSKLDEVFRRYDELAQRSDFTLLPSNKASLSPGGRERLTDMGDQLARRSGQPDLTARLLELIETADDLTLAHIRPYVLADYWGQPRQTVLELCLLATRIGLLVLHWDLLCPLCRGTKESLTNLGALPGEVHCETCNIDFRANFARSVEITFRPAAVVRDIGENNNYCISGPHETPHVVMQQLLQPGDYRSLQPSLEPGRYRVRTLTQPGYQSIMISQEAHETRAEVTIQPGGWAPEEPQLREAPYITVENRTSAEQLFIMERTAWTDQAATAAEVITLQQFRDLFADEALRPGERISVGSLTVVFTDLRDSTALYNSLGDAPAFGLVMDHFDILRDIIREEGGSVVKTIGDAVMAVFLRPIGAVRGLLRARQALAHAEPPLTLKAGVNHGPCIAVTLNDRLDYFGSTVNIAARLQALSTGQEIIVSEAVYHDPEVHAMLAQPDILAEPVEVTLKGFEGERFNVWAIVEK